MKIFMVRNCVTEIFLIEKFYERNPRPGHLQFLPLSATENSGNVLVLEKSHTNLSSLIETKKLIPLIINLEALFDGYTISQFHKFVITMFEQNLFKFRPT